MSAGLGDGGMKPNEAFITLGDNATNIVRLIQETIAEPRLKLLEWSRMTHQTANIRIGYPGQHLASLVTGVEGTRTGARGHDLRDGSEVKSCSRIDQLDKCRECGASVARFEQECPQCGSMDVERKNDSKWLFSVRSDEELDQLVKYDRVLLMLGDYPGFDQGDYDTLRFQAFEIWPKSARSVAFAQIMIGYYQNIYIPKLDKVSSPAPKNFWPYSFQFYKCAPVRVMEALVTNASTAPEVELEYLLDPREDRAGVESPAMPANLLKASEGKLLTEIPDDLLVSCLKQGVSPLEFRRAKSGDRLELLHEIPPAVLERIPLRTTDRPVNHATVYKRAPIR